MTEKERFAQKKASIINAFLIGLMIGIIVWSVAKNNVGFFTLIPLFFAYKIFNNSKKNEVLEE